MGCKIKATLFTTGELSAMLEAKIVNTGRVPEIAGTRITVYDVISTRSHALSVGTRSRGCG
jgi:uncharacterized protein (DUF433 family)